ncbi:hypothetical protein HanPSC8_Chr11g0476991 [Helianthus annuus]|nr:hypothetical protein HanPSC8_Chr11g0476991 [Helianthus annuus]
MLRDRQAGAGDPTELRWGHAALVSDTPNKPDPFTSLFPLVSNLANTKEVGRVPTGDNRDSRPPHQSGEERGGAEVTVRRSLSRTAGRFVYPLGRCFYPTSSGSDGGFSSTDEDDDDGGDVIDGGCSRRK